MKIVILSALLALTLAAPEYINGGLPVDDSSSEEDQPDVVPILRDERIQEDDGRFNVDVETGNGIFFSESGAPKGPDGAVVMAGQYSYTAPDGTLVEMKFVADENGFQPESSLLPVAPEFPHPIPQFVIDQIEFAAQQDALESAEDHHEDSESSSDEFDAPANLYGSPY
ncbi:Cuticle protein AMP1A [Chionoecetes opilio]|uniref:Cuticle protein AMP1A n=1 Tax=Chionoecetes opilio TaxID=41210 RepID=A0A8J4XYE4_CHIOP|nr:Cuticle protein AMP1A [Chionoecetes opilio]